MLHFSCYSRCNDQIVDETIPDTYISGRATSFKNDEIHRIVISLNVLLRRIGFPSSYIRWSRWKIYSPTKTIVASGISYRELLCTNVLVVYRFSFHSKFSYPVSLLAHIETGFFSFGFKGEYQRVIETQTRILRR